METKQQDIQESQKDIKNRIEYLIERIKDNWSVDKPEDPSFYTGSNCWVCSKGSASYFKGVARICSDCREKITSLSNGKNKSLIKEFAKKVFDKRQEMKEMQIKEFKERLEYVKDNLKLSKEEIDNLKNLLNNDKINFQKDIERYEKEIKTNKTIHQKEKIESKIEKYKKQNYIFYRFEDWIYENFDRSSDWAIQSVNDRFERYKEIQSKMDNKVKELFLNYSKRYFDEDSYVSNLYNLKKLIEKKTSLTLTDEEFSLMIYDLHFNIQLGKLNEKIRKKFRTIESLSKSIFEFLGKSPSTKEEVFLIETYLFMHNLNYPLQDIIYTIKNFEETNELENFEKKLLRTSQKPSKREIEKMSGFDFEKFIASCFQEKGYNVKLTKSTGDQGADLILEDKKGVLTAVQIKKYSGNVGNKAVQEVVASMKFYDCDKAMIVTTGVFTKSAFELASKNGVQLISKKELDDLI